MADNNENNDAEDPRTLYQRFVEMATSKGLEDDDVDDFVETKMRRAGFKKGPGDWISLDDDNETHDDDDKPMTRGDWRRMQKERKQQNARQLPKKESTTTQKSGSNDPWW